MKKITMLFLLLLFAWIATAQQTVVDIIVNSPDHTTLETAVIEAGLVGTLSGDGPYTVFAPTDDAFDALPDGVLQDLLDDPEGLLTDILLYHVVGGESLSTDLSDGLEIETLNGATVTVTINDDGVFINDAQVTVADLVADNGVVHVINAVLLPPSNTVYDIIANSDIHTTLKLAIDSAGLAQTLQSEGTFTVFAPTDEAFDALPAGTLQDLLENPQGLLRQILLYHTTSEILLSSDLNDGQIIFTQLPFQETLTVTINDDGVFINDAMVTVVDLEGDNGVVHVIDAVLIPSPPSVMDIVANSTDHAILTNAINAAQLSTTLDGDGTFTLFAPTDAAFMALPDGALDALLDDPSGLLTQVLLYHVVGSNEFSTDLSDGQEIVTLNGATVTVTINDDGVFINDAQVTLADIEAENGVVHVIDAVLVPPSDPFTVVDIILESDIHTTLATAVAAADLVETLEGEGPFTVFAPTDAAFDALPAGTLDALLADPSGLLTDILLYHVVGGQALSTDLSNGLEIETLNGATITVTINDDGVFINDAQVTVADLVVDNGVVHVIDAVLLPPSDPFTVVDIILESDIHTTLATAVAAAGLVETLQGEGPFTVFAPTDAAFDALPDGVLQALLDDPDGELTRILLYHVVGGTALSTDLQDGQFITTVLGQRVEVTINDDGVFINDAQVTVADLTADNGVVHVIDAVLQPEGPATVMDIIAESTVHNALRTALEATELDDVLRGEGPFTVFAPTDAAFMALPPGLLDQLLQEPEGELTQILLYHVIGGGVYASDLENGQMVVTVQGQDVTITINDDGVFVNDAEITVVDLEADNGVVHVIDAVLLPEPELVSIYEIISNSPDHTTLTSIVDLLGINEDLDDDEAGELTVFAPTDDAFAALGQDVIDALLSDPFADLLQIIRHHVTVGSVLSTALSDGLEVTMASGQTTMITINDDGVFIDDAKITVVDLVATNGVVHVIDAILLPELTVCDIALEVYQTFNSQFGGAPQPDALGNCESFSLEFSAWASEAYQIGNFVEGVTYNFSICEGAGAGSWDPQLSVLDINGNFVATVEDCEITWVAEYSGTYLILINEVGACGPGSENTEVNNGVPTLTCQGRAATVMDIIENSEVHTTLTAAINAADLNNTLRGEGPFTVFAPTDAAFGALDPAIIDALLADPGGELTQILLYHVVGGTALSTDLTNNQMIETLNGQEVTVTITGEGVFINDAQVVIADLEAENGVVHVIDAVLIPEGVLSTRDVAEAFPGVQVYPNPASSTLFVDLQAIKKPIQRVRMMDMTGRTLDTYIINSERKEIPVAQMPTGTYFLEFMIDGNLYFKKILINR